MPDPQTPTYEYLNKTGLSRYDSNIKSLINQKTIKVNTRYETSPATHAHSVDDYIYYNNHVYKVTSAISVGDTIAVTSGSTIGNVEVDDTLPEDCFVTLANVPGSGSGENVDELFKTKQNNEYIVSHTILSSSWSNGVYSFESLYPSSTWDIVNILPNSSTTDEMRAAWAAADCGGYEATNIITAHGTTPEINLVMTLVLRYKTPGAEVPIPDAE